MGSSEDSTEARLAWALAHPLRARVLEILDDEVASPKELSQRLGVPLGTVAYHVRVLASLNLIELVDVTRARGALQHRYTAVRRASGERS